MGIKNPSNFFHYDRRQTREIMIGTVGIGADNPIRVQSMITTDTLDTESSVKEVLQLADEGCEIVRITERWFSLRATKTEYDVSNDLGAVGYFGANYENTTPRLHSRHPVFWGMLSGFDGIRRSRRSNSMWDRQ